jgi:hypothetical protein
MRTILWDGDRRVVLTNATKPGASSVVYVVDVDRRKSLSPPDGQILGSLLAHSEADDWSETVPADISARALAVIQPTT